MAQSSADLADAADLAADRARALELTPVSRETAARLDRFVDMLLRRGSAHTNLIARSTIPNSGPATSPIRFSSCALAPEARCWVDLGSGARLSGLVIACALADRAGAAGPSGRKQRQESRLPARSRRAPASSRPWSIAVRIEDFVKNFKAKPDVVSARALAPLDELLKLAHPLLKTGAQGLFPKGQDVEGELTKASKYWNIEAELGPEQDQPGWTHRRRSRAAAGAPEIVNYHVRSRR